MQQHKIPSTPSAISPQQESTEPSGHLAIVAADHPAARDCEVKLPGETSIVGVIDGAILAVYKRPRDGDCPLVCLDEASKQLLAGRRALIPMKPGQPARCDYEYERNRTANLFMMFAPLEGWRRVKGTDRRTAVDYAQALEDLSDRQSLGDRVDLNTALQGGTLPIYINLEFHVFTD